jgi:hypothetical protein
MQPSSPYSEPRTNFVEICSCGHALRAHTLSTCEGSQGTCHCKKIHRLFVVESANSFCKPHTSVGIGHALIQGVLGHPEESGVIDLSHKDLGRNPECYRCRRPTTNLMPLLVNRHSLNAVKDVSKGRMTRLWCDICCELEEISFLPHVANVIDRGWKNVHKRTN